ncbi:MAG TPA: non-canonical purine NTP pyrophosphatase [Acidobacteriaceae bacterium]|nr:non-canonical purine NTP pyrophosphatase [Acidobacteriaceae bacterium]
MTLIIYAATTNPGKLRDFSVAADDGGFSVQPLPGLREIPAPDEDAPTFAGNARLKAEYYSRLASDPSALILADDSGLEVDALRGAPGVRSARYAQDANYAPGPSSSASLGWLGDDPVDIRNNLYLLDQMRDVANRRARYHCVLAVARAGATILTADGAVEGEILSSPSGRGGFGYDPLFWLPDLGRTMAEISLEEKHALSHRGRAFRALLPQLRQILG